MKIGDKIKTRRIELGLSVDELAEKIGKNRSTVYRYENNEIEHLPTTILEPLVRALQVSPDYFMSWEDLPTKKEREIEKIVSQFDNISPIQTQRLPLLGEIACGEPIFCDEDRESYVEVGTNIRADFCLRAKGDSMINARICDGDIVFIRRQPMVENGDIAAVIIDNEATLKRVYFDKENGKLVLQAENPKYKPLMYVGEELNSIRILGKAIAFESNL